MNSVGIDPHRHRSRVAAIDEQGELVLSRRLVNTNTVLRALRLLRDEGLLEMGRGRAIPVAGGPDQGAVITQTKELVEFASRHDYRRDELIALMYRLSWPHEHRVAPA